MSTLAVVVVAVVAALVLLAIGGAIATARRTRALEPSLQAQVAQANQELAAAHAEDKGWEPAGLEAAGREAFAAAHPGEEAEQLTLVQVVDRPGTEDDLAVFRVATAGGDIRFVTLGRRDGAWVPVQQA